MKKFITVTGKKTKIRDMILSGVDFACYLIVFFYMVMYTVLFAKACVWWKAILALYSAIYALYRLYKIVKQLYKSRKGLSTQKGK